MRGVLSYIPGSTLRVPLQSKSDTVLRYGIPRQDVLQGDRVPKRRLRGDGIPFCLVWYGVCVDSDCVRFGAFHVGLFEALALLTGGSMGVREFTAEELRHPMPLCRCKGVKGHRSLDPEVVQASVSFTWCLRCGKVWRILNGVCELTTQSAADFV